MSENRGMDAMLFEMVRLAASEVTSSAYCCANIPPHELPKM